MNALRSWLRVVIVLVVAAAALPALAATPDKLFSVSTNQTTIVAGATNAPVTVTVTNQTPQGNSYINTVKLTVPVGVTFTVTSIQTVNGSLTTTGGTASPSSGNGGTTISISNITGVRPGGRLLVNLAISTPASASCSAAQWTGAAWTGNSFNGDSFAPFPNADSNVAPVYVGCDGVLPCNASFTKPANLGPNDPGYAASTRAFFNKDGASNGNGCVPVPYSFDNSLITSNQAYLKWLLQDTAVFTTSVNSALRAVGPSGIVTAATPKVAWLTHPSTGLPVFIDGQACLGTNPPTNLPAPYGTLQTAMSNASGTFTITINTSGAVVPLPAVGNTVPVTIGRERMQATVQSATSLSVSRPTGGTSAQAHAIGALIMSSPLPLLVTPSVGWTAAQIAAGYTAGLQAQMCVLESGWASGGVDAGGLPLVYDFSTVIDIGDGWIVPN